MLWALLAVMGGLAVLVWGAGRFVDGAAAVAQHLGMPILLIGVLVFGFGTSAPEMVISVSAAMQGNPGMALGNVVGSNIVNIGMVLGITALLVPIRVQSNILRREMPVLLIAMLVIAGLLLDLELSRTDGFIMLGVFAVVAAGAIWDGLRSKGDVLASEVEQELKEKTMSLATGWLWLAVGFVLLVGSSQVLVWGAVKLAIAFGVSDLVIGLTIVAAGTSLPELASSIIACKKSEHDLAMGNVIGSNIFNGLAVLGVAASISPMTVEPAILYRDVSVMVGFTVALVVLTLGFRNRRVLTKAKGGVFLVAYIGYTVYLIVDVFAKR